YNRAGSTRTKLATAYRENAIHFACCLLVTGRTSPAALRAMGTGPKTLSILRFNAYGWFERVDTSVYGLSAHAAADRAARHGRREARPGGRRGSYPAQRHGSRHRVELRGA